MAHVVELVLAAVVGEADGAVEHLHGLGHGGLVDLVFELNRNTHRQVHLDFFFQIPARLHYPVEEYLLEAPRVELGMEELEDSRALLQYFQIYSEPGDDIETAGKPDQAYFPS